MDSSVSGRPLTPLASSVPLISTPDDSAEAGTSSYQPSLFDLIFAFGLTRNLFTTHVPSTFLQAASVDSSRTLGQGASFTASLRALPEGPKTISSTQVLPTFTITTTSPAPVRPKHVVFKVAKVAFDSRGDPLPEYRSALQSVLTELHALLYPPLFNHRNIVNILGLAWGTNPFAQDQRLPALVLEYAEHGTLRDVLSRRILTSVEKRLLCFDVASGLLAIHEAGLVHGDVKAENVLICGPPDRRVAKLADFGFSVVQESESQDIWLGGTKPWQAPEVRRAVPIAEAMYTDTYSFGLLTWSMAIDGMDPFRRFLSSDDPAASWDDELQEFKEKDGLLRASQVSVWLPIHLTRVLAETPEHPAVSKVVGAMRNFDTSLQMTLLTQACTAFVKSDQWLALLDHVFANTLLLDPLSRSLKAVVDILRPATDTRFGNNEPERSITRSITNTSDKHLTFRDAPVQSNKALDHQPPSQTSEKVPTSALAQSSQGSKDLARTAKDNDDSLLLATLDGKEPKPVQLGSGPTLPADAKPSWSTRGFKHLWLSWQAVRDLSPALQRIVCQAYVALEDTDEQGGARLFLLSAVLMNGYGCQVNEQHALRVLRRSAEMGHHIARAYLYRVHASCGVMEVTGVDIKQHLETYAKLGSRAAWGGYNSTHSRQQTMDLYRIYTDAYAGVGADWYATENMLHGLQQQDWIKDDFLISQAETLDNVKQFQVNKRGDTLLHLAAACGRWKPLKYLMEKCNFDVNCRNNAGDTPLTCAMRSGQGGNVYLLCTMFNADPTLASANGETPLHWLLNMEIPSVPLVAKDLVERGAVVDAMTKASISHSVFPSNVDSDFQMPGTPLGWAVHHNKIHAVKVLLEYGASPYHDNDINAMGPLNWAAYYHHHECLRSMIDALETRLQESESTNERKSDPRYAVMYSPLLRNAVHAADRWSMILRNGVNWRTNLHATLDILREKTKLVRPAKKFGGPNQTLLYYAVSEGHDEVVEYMIDHHWHTEEINETCGDLLQTPVLEAVRWNRTSLVNMLVVNGADVHARSCNPFRPERKDWCALHVLAHEGHDAARDELLPKLLGYGLDVGGRSLKESSAANRPSGQASSDAIDALTSALDAGLILEDDPVESPLSCALRSNAFQLCDSLRKYEASLASASRSAGLYEVKYPTTILGHIVVSNARYSIPRLRYVLNALEPGDEDSLFVVEAERGLTALHRAAMANDGVSTTFGTAIQREDFDMETNAEMTTELVLHFKSPQYLDARCDLGGRTALMLAVENLNLQAIRLLLKAGADASIEDEDGRTALEYAVDKVEEASSSTVAAEWEQVLRLFELE